MEFRVLQYFLAIAREETILGAAQSLHISQPTLSRQIKELEESLGKQLFVRGNRKITLTEDGMLLRQRAEEIITLVEKTENEIITSDTTISGDIYIGGGETEAMRIIAKAIHTCTMENPDIRFHLYSGNSQDVIEKIEKGLLDFGIFVGPTDMSKYDFITLPQKDRWGVLMRKDSPLAKQHNIVAEDLLNLPLMTSQQQLVKNQLSGWLEYDFDQLNITATYNLLYNASLMVEEKNGYALALDKIIKTSGGRTLCFRPLEPKLEVEIAFAWKKYKIFSRAAQYFIDILREEISST